MNISYNPSIALITLIRKEIKRILRIWPQTFVPPIISTILYFLIFGGIIGKHVGKMGGVSYLDFIAPGLVLMSVINLSYINVSSSFYGARFMRNIEEIAVSPMPSWSILMGFVCGGVFRGITVSTVILITSLFFLHHSLYNIPLMLLTAIICSVIFSLGGFINGILARTFDDTSIFANFILLPLIYLGGVFYDIKALPHFWFIVSLINPIHWLIALFRHAMLGVPMQGSVIVASLILLAVLITIYTVAWSLLNKGVGIRS